MTTIQEPKYLLLPAITKTRQGMPSLVEAFDIQLEFATKLWDDFAEACVRSAFQMLLYKVMHNYTPRQSAYTQRRINRLTKKMRGRI